MNDLREHLRELSESGERGDPLVFAGREYIIDKVIRKTRQLPPTGPAGNTVLIEGAPGAGKTALLNELAKRLEAQGASVVARPEIPSQNNIETIYAKLATALAQAPSGSGRTTTHRTRQTSVRIAGAGVGRTSGESTTVIRFCTPSGGAGVNRKSGESTASQKILDPDDIAALRQSRPWADRDRAVVLMDEIQNIASGEAAVHFVRTLHTQTSIPVLLVCAGLSNSEKTLASVGLSRIGSDNVINLGPLSLEESVDCARRTYGKLMEEGLHGSEPQIERWARRVAAASDGWPRHLQNYFRASWLALADQDAPSLSDANLDEVVRRGDSFREAYYNARLKLANVPVEVIAALYRRMMDGERLDEFQAIGVLANAIETLPDPHVGPAVRKRFPSDDECFEQLLKVGVISMDSAGFCTSPVPSFTRYVLSRVGAKNVGDKYA